MKTLFLLLSPKIKSIRNSITLSALLKRIPFSVIGLIFWIFFYIGSYKVLQFIRGIEFFGETVSKNLISMTFFSLFVFLLMSNTITALSSFYVSKDVPFLMSKPIVITFTPPLFIAYGISYHAPLYFYFMLVLTFIPFLLIPGNIGIVLAHLFTRLFPAKKTRFLLLAIGLFIFIFMYILIKSQWSLSSESPERFIHSILAVKIDSPLLPSFWITEFIMPIIKGQTPDILYFLLLFSNGAFMFILCGFFGNRLYINNLERVQPSVRISGKMSKVRFYPGANWAVLWKDIKIFFRDAGQWPQLFIIGALILIYIYNFRTLPLKTLNKIFPFVKELMVLINMLMAGLVLSAVSARFLYASVSLEGMAFWIIRTSPVNIRKILWSKFLYGFIPVTIILLGIVLSTNIAMDADNFLIFISGVTILILCISISGLGTGMGAMYPKFKYENVASISMSPGGMFFMLIAFSIVLLSVSLEALSFYLYRKAALSGVDLNIIKKGLFILTGVLVFVINGFAFYIPMRMGEKRLEKDYGD
jgi:ABC-2 type transport system permease protein